jgi:hypothetical protein
MGVMFLPSPPLFLHMANVESRYVARNSSGKQRPLALLLKAAASCILSLNITAVVCYAARKNPISTHSQEDATWDYCPSAHELRNEVVEELIAHLVVLIWWGEAVWNQTPHC